ncbi:MAG: hypothetical protein DMF72_11655 [Acidobacteria bacterium]|nr:MAG: hypothetical protein DMF72_11655 [Acidobacteriota bacterium]
MENKDALTGTLVRLPDGQPVRIETVHSDGYASVRRIEGERTGMIAVCATDKLEPIVASLDR